MSEIYIYIDTLYRPSSVVTIETGGCDSTTGVLLSHEARLLYKIDALANKFQFRMCRVNYCGISSIVLEYKNKGNVLPMP
jgi:hypothetical protein